MSDPVPPPPPPSLIDLMPPAPGPQPLGVKVSQRDLQPLVNTIVVSMKLSGVLPGAAP